MGCYLREIRDQIGYLKYKVQHREMDKQMGKAGYYALKTNKNLLKLQKSQETSKLITLLGINDSFRKD